MNQAISAIVGFCPLTDGAAEPLRHMSQLEYLGIFNLVGGAALLLASVIAGALWSSMGPAATFVAGASFAALAMVGVAAVRQPSNDS